MPLDSYVQVAPDNVEGKKVDMDQVATAAGSTVYRQKAILVGESGNIEQQLLQIQRQQLVVLRAILGCLQMNVPAFGVVAPNTATEDDFTFDVSTNNE